jgi:predicted RNA-binding protein with PUA-like domain
MTRTTHWLIKAEPNSRIVKGKDVKVSAIFDTLCFYSITSASKFSVEDFEQVGTTSWEGVRNPEARNLMKEMLVGDKVHLVRNLSSKRLSTRSRFYFITLVATIQVCIDVENCLF